MKKRKKVLFKFVVAGFCLWLPALAVMQVCLLIVSWFDTPASELLRIPFVSRLFAQVPFLAFLQHLLGVAVVLALVAAVFFFTGMFVMTWLGKKMRYHVETRLLSFIPLYNFFKSIVVRFWGEHGDVPFLSRFDQPVFVHVFNRQTFQTGLLTSGSEHATSGICTVCVPPAPNVLAGAVYNVPIEYVHFLRMSTSDAVSAVAAWGVGTDELITRYVAERIQSGVADYACILGSRCPLEREVRKAMQRQVKEM